QDPHPLRGPERASANVDGRAARPQAVGALDDGHPVAEAGEPVGRREAGHAGAGDEDVHGDAPFPAGAYSLKSLAIRITACLSKALMSSISSLVNRRFGSPSCSASFAFLLLSAAMSMFACHSASDDAPMRWSGSSGRRIQLSLRSLRM